MSDIPVLNPIEAYALWAEEYPPHAHNPMMLAEERAMLSLLPADLAGQRVCDAGCGTGRYLIEAWRRGARDLIGVDLSPAMLSRASAEIDRMFGIEERTSFRLEPGSVEALPIPEDWADVTLCCLTLGHLPTLETALAELRRVTRAGGMVLCSDLHPDGKARGWQRTFKAGGSRFAVRHTWHTQAIWRDACARVGLRVVRVLEPYLNPADIPAGARFDPAALTMPVALVLQLTPEPADTL